jgi:hypothetical protein
VNGFRISEESILVRGESGIWRKSEKEWTLDVGLGWHAATVLRRDLGIWCSHARDSFQERT